MNAFNSLGFEVESVSPFVVLEGLKFGRVTKTYKNPNADNLTVCEVAFFDKVRVIQTAAKNVKEKDYVVAFVEGAKKGDTVFGVKKFKGIVSEGMLASWQELGFNSKLLPPKFQEGVAILEKADLSLDPIKYFELDDYLIEISVLTNRTEANSYFVLVEELKAFFKLHPTTSTNFSTSRLPIVFEIAAQDLESLSKKDMLFVAKHNLVAKNSKEVLMGLLALNYGAWSQLYDPKHFQTTESFEVYNAQTTLFLDGKTVLRSGSKPEPEFLPTSSTQIIRLAIFPIQKDVFRKIRDEEGEVSNTGGILSKQTGFIFLDVVEFIKARFNTAVLRVITTQAEHFNSSVEVNTNLLEQYTNVKNILTTERGQDTLGQIKRLGFKVEGEKVFPPSYRSNINSSEEFVEEFVRFFGYSNLEPEPPKITNVLVKAQSKLKAKLSALGYQEFLSFTLVRPENNTFNPLNISEAETLITQAASGRQEVRKSVFNTLVESLNHNIKRKFTRFSVFDIGLIATEKQSLFLATSLYEFQELKQQVVSLFPNKQFEFITVTESNEFLIPSLSVWIKEEGKVIGWIGSIHPFYFEHDFLFCELLLKDFKDDVTAPTSSVVYKPYSKQSLKHRSVTFELQQKESVKEYVDSLQKHAGVFQVFLKDVYENHGRKKATLDVLLEEGFEEAFDEKYN